MHIVRLSGGFANQLMQYVYGRYLEYRIGEPVYYDDSRLIQAKAHNGYELKRVYGLNLLLLSNYYPKIIFDTIVDRGIPMCQVMYNAGVDIEVVRGLTSNFDNLPFTGRIIKYDKKTAFTSVSYSRYHWTYALEYPEYYEEIKEILDRELVFPPFPDEKNRNIAYQIDECNSVGIHIRLGDFETIGWLTAPIYYKMCIEWAENNVCPDKYYIFSNEPDYCKAHMEEYGFSFVDKKLSFVEGNSGINDYVDFQLMSMCKHIITAPYSTFSRCATVFNKNIKTVINGGTIGLDSKQYFGWKRT